MFVLKLSGIQDVLKLSNIQNVLRLRLSRLEEEERLHEAAEAAEAASAASAEDHPTQDHASADQDTAKEEYADANDKSEVNGDCEAVIPGSSNSYYANVEHYKRNRKYNSDDC